MQSANSTTPRKDTKEIENTVPGFKDIVIQREREKKKRHARSSQVNHKEQPTSHGKFNTNHPAASCGLSP